MLIRALRGIFDRQCQLGGDGSFYDQFEDAQREIIEHLAERRTHKGVEFWVYPSLSGDPDVTVEAQVKTTYYDDRARDCRPKYVEWNMEKLCVDLEAKGLLPVQVEAKKDELIQGAMDYLDSLDDQTA